MLITHSIGDDTAAPPVLIVHGLFGSARNWGVIAKRMSAQRRILTVDMRNHGESPWHTSHSYADLASDLAEVIAAHGGAADVLGHSMGGKAAMMLALQSPELVRRLMVADIAPVSYRHSQSHLIAALRRVPPDAMARRSEADAALTPLIEEAGVRAFLLQSLDTKAEPPKWRLNLDVLEAEMDKITGWPEVSGTFEGPVFMLSGAASDYVLPEHRETIKALFPQARFAKIPKAGHWLHAENPRAFQAAAEAFLNG
ncbi:alpha/beta fold hydrolase [Alphaproteobacteria bacterium KMM 3653]|uniref:Alpha/beta fold hydrolase n=1 Tax=Harenicola maris TaxID=2841044 RepID=A0AAP2CSA8_9RHOB|nr:alpha/beta fold hydrolase [Harenicola maris]